MIQCHQITKRKHWEQTARARHGRVLRKTPKAQALKVQVNKLDYVKPRSFCTERETINKMKKQATEWKKLATEWKKLFVNYELIED